tara:strand:- start:310 stop:876 length:567 start_codon:yes stop_codon:yes gene_type:complete
MSELTITHNGIAQTAKTSSDKKGGKIVTVTPVVTVGTTSADSVLFISTEIPNAVRIKGGVSKLMGFSLINYDLEKHDMDLVFTQKQQNLGSINSTPDTNDALMRASKILGISKIDYSDQSVDITTGTNVLSTFSAVGATGSNIWRFSPMLVQAAEDSTSIYISAVAREDIDFAAANDLEIILHFEYLD